MIIVFAAIAHWIFAINYFKSAINISTFINWESMDIEERRKRKTRNEKVIKIINVAFVAIIIVSQCLCFGLGSPEDYYYLAFNKS